MSAPSEWDDPSRSADWARREELIERFEAAWLGGRRPAIEDHLPSEPGDRRAVLIELVHAELELRLRAGELARVEDYLRRFPELGEDAGVLLDLVAAEYARRRDREPGLAMQKYLERFPAHQQELRNRLPASPEPPGAAAGPTVPPGPKAAPPVSGYEVLEELGRGGMGVVYRGWDPRLNRPVAIKRLLPGGRAAAARQRFLAEARLVAQLDHPHIARVYHSGEEDGQPWFAMEYVSGGSLEQALGKGPQCPHVSARLVLLLARAVHHAHQAGIVHRDLKPANVLLAPPADEPALNCAWGCPKISDFGLARELGSSGEGTETGQVLGTLAYMAPEQAQGRKDVGPAADVYALGVILYRVLAGRVPFQGDSTFETLEKIVREPPPPPSRLAAGLPVELEVICLKCLAKSPAERYGSALALAEDLGRFLGDEWAASVPGGTTAVLPAIPRRDSPGSRWRRPVILLGEAGGLAVLLLVAALLGGLTVLALVLVVLGVVLLVVGALLLRGKWPAYAWAGQFAGGIVLLGGAAITHYNGGVPVHQSRSDTNSSSSIVAFRVHHLRIVDGKREDHGEIGRDSFEPRFGDLVTVDVELSAPGYLYLVAFNPDGKEQLLAPPAEEDDEDGGGSRTPPPQLKRLTYPFRNPQTGKPLALPLDDEPAGGLQALAVLVSGRLLPAYQDYLKARGPVGWGKMPGGKGVWLGDTKGVYQARRGLGVLRGKPVDLPGVPPLMRLARELSVAGVEQAEVLAFPVRPKGD
jgi:hypothetical protein